MFSLLFAFPLFADEYTISVSQTAAQTSNGLFVEQWNKIKQDHRNYYSKSLFWKLGLAVGTHAVISNTSIDQNFRNWYQNDVRSSGTDETEKVFKKFGEGKFLTPLLATSIIAACVEEKCPYFTTHGVAGEFASKTLRSYLVGLPTLGMGQITLGCSRPSENRPWHSAWRPFQDTKSFSGHAFNGAVPFLAAAAMTDKIYLKSVFYACSTFTGISRINGDHHYLSQVLCGWYVAYLSVEAVSKTDNRLEKCGITFFPVMEAEYTGVGLHWRY